MPALLQGSELPEARRQAITQKLHDYTGPPVAYLLKSNPKMKVLLAGGYYDLATPYFEGKFEMHHLPIPQALQKNISYHYYASGHMVYVNEEVLKQFHADVAAFIQGTQSGR